MDLLLLALIGGGVVWWVASHPVQGPTPRNEPVASPGVLQAESYFEPGVFDSAGWPISGQVYKIVTDPNENQIISDNVNTVIATLMGLMLTRMGYQPNNPDSVAPTQTSLQRFVQDYLPHFRATGTSQNQIMVGPGGAALNVGDVKLIFNAIAQAYAAQF